MGAAGSKGVPGAACTRASGAAAKLGHGRLTRLQEGTSRSRSLDGSIPGALASRLVTLGAWRDFVGSTARTGRWAAFSSVPPLSSVSARLLRSYDAFHEGPLAGCRNGSGALVLILFLADDFEERPADHASGPANLPAHEQMRPNWTPLRMINPTPV